jgi:hypothetical protein
MLIAMTKMLMVNWKMQEEIRHDWRRTCTSWRVVQYSAFQVVG